MINCTIGKKDEGKRVQQGKKVLKTIFANFYHKFAPNMYLTTKILWIRGEQVLGHVPFLLELVFQKQRYLKL